MRGIFLFILLLTSHVSSARDGYKIRVKLNDRQDTVVYLAYYFGKPLPTIFKTDSARLDRNGEAVFENKNKITGGIYIVLPADRTAWFEMLIDNGAEFSVNATLSSLPESVKFTGSPENSDFNDYHKLLKRHNEERQQLMEHLAVHTTKEDSNRVSERLNVLHSEQKDWRKDYIKKHPDRLLSAIYSALQTPEIPEGPHLKPDGSVDSQFAWRYYKSHFWNGFNFNDDRLIHTPLYDNKLSEYFNKVLPQHPDSVIAEADSLLHKVKGAENLFKYSLNWLSTNAQTSQVMGMDKVFVHLVDNYYMKGDATWLSETELAKYIDRAKKIAPNIINNPAPDLSVLDVNNRPLKLSQFNAQHTLLIFYDPDCGHCKKEIPVIDSLYRAELKARGVRVFAFNVEVEEEKWRKFIEEKNLQDWTHVWDPQRRSRYWALYDVQATPSLFLLDSNKIIRAKRLNHENILKAVEISERQINSEKKE